MALQNVQDHFLVPKHEIVPEEKISEVLEKYGVKKSEMPRISRLDPIVKEIGAKKGDLLKIIRNSSLAGRTIYFRFVH